MDKIKSSARFSRAPRAQGQRRLNSWTRGHTVTVKAQQHAFFFSQTPPATTREWDCVHFPRLLYHRLLTPSLFLLASAWFCKAAAGALDLEWRCEFFKAITKLKILKCNFFENFPELLVLPPIVNPGWTFYSDSYWWAELTSSRAKLVGKLPSYCPPSILSPSILRFKTVLRL